MTLARANDERNPAAGAGNSDDKTIAAGAVVVALIAALDDPECATAVARKLEPFIRSRVEAERWLDTKAAAAHLGITANALHKLTAARTIPFHQENRNGRCWFLRSELDAWRKAAGVHQFPRSVTRQGRAA